MYSSILYSIYWWQYNYQTSCILYTWGKCFRWISLILLATDAEKTSWDDLKPLKWIGWLDMNLLQMWQPNFESYKWGSRNQKVKETKENYNRCWRYAIQYLSILFQLKDLPKNVFHIQRMLWHDFWIAAFIQRGNHIFCWHLIYSLNFTSSKNLQLSLFHPALFFTSPFQLHRVLDQASSSPANEICFVNNWYALLTAPTGLGDSKQRRKRKLLLKSTWFQKCEIHFMTIFYIICCCSFDHLRMIHAYIFICLL